MEEVVKGPVQETEKLRRGCAHLKVSDFFDPSKPWILVKNGSCGGVFGELNESTYTESILNIILNSYILFMPNCLTYHFSLTIMYDYYHNTT